MGKRRQWIGEVFGKLTVVSLRGRRKNKKIFECLCECGNTHLAMDTNLSRGHTKSCGCLQRLMARDKLVTHGMTTCGEYNSWVNMKQRCMNKNNHAYDRYGGRGICIYEPWINDFAAFFAHIGPKPAGDYSVERMDNNKGYEPGNVKWATRSEQMSNRREFRLGGMTIQFDGRDYTVRELSKMSGVSPSTLYKRLENGWRPEDLCLPADKKYAAKRPSCADA